MDNKQEVWKQVQEFYKDKFDIESNMVELATNFDILKMCANGSSNNAIADFLEVDEKLVSSVIDKYLEFTGWEINLYLSPLRVYRDLGSKDLDSFRNAVVASYGYKYDIMTINPAYKSAEIVSNLERLLDEKWV